MVTKGEIAYLANLASLIRSEGPISHTHLVLRSRKSQSYFEKMRKFLPELFHDIEYDKSVKMWKTIETEENDDKLNITVEEIGTS